MIFVLAGGVTWILSRQILRPLGLLTRGTEAMARLRFDTRIEVRTRDEFALLASGFNRMAGALEGYEVMRKQWVLDISHELRTPLSILRGEIEAVQDKVRPVTPSTLESLLAEVAYLESLVRDFHLLSLADAGTLAMTLGPVRPGEILRSVLALFGPRFDGAGLTVDDRLDNPKAEVPGDPDRLRSFFLNILENNLRYTGKPGVVTVRDEVGDGCLVIVIEDSGPGVPRESLPRLFDRLYRVDRSRLGLAICRVIAEAHEGSVSAADSPLGGLAVTLRLPLEASS
jgi:two-component system sensor histidine kinase BaeS